jgi:hypothetical protein
METTPKKEFVNTKLFKGYLKIIKASLTDHDSKAFQ